MIGGGGGKAGHVPGRRQDNKKKGPVQSPGTQKGGQGEQQDVSHDSGTQTHSALVHTGSSSAVMTKTTLTPDQSEKYDGNARQPQQPSSAPVTDNQPEFYPQLAGDTGVDPLIVALVNRSIDKINEHDGDFHDADDADVFLFLATIVAINEYMQDSGGGKGVGMSGALSPAREELEKFLQRNGLEGYLRPSKRP